MAAAKPEVPTREECEALGKKVIGMVAAPKSQVTFFVNETTTSTFARGDTHMANQARRIYITLTVEKDGQGGNVTTTQMDEPSLRTLVEEADRIAGERRGRLTTWQPFGPQQYATPGPLRFEASIDAMSADARSDTCRRILTALQRDGLTGAGSLDLTLKASSIMNSEGLFGYVTETSTGLSVSARTADGMGAGWGWAGPADWGRVDVDAVAARAADLARRSAKPVAVEPGRYTVIMEPCALAEFVHSLIGSLEDANAGYTAFAGTPKGTNKIGRKMIDERLSVVTDLWDPEHMLPTVSTIYGGLSMKNVTWFDHGVLTNLMVNGRIAKQLGLERIVAPDGVRIAGDGPTQTLDEMIASTKRGIWINRVGSIWPVSTQTGLVTGTTRDGAFLIENGKITKAIKNLRFTESIFFILNRLEAFGDPVRASPFSVVPRIKVRDFDFTSLTDAI